MMLAHYNVAFLPSLISCIASKHSLRTPPKLWLRGSPRQCSPRQTLRYHAANNAKAEPRRPVLLPCFTLFKGCAGDVRGMKMRRVTRYTSSTLQNSTVAAVSRLPINWHLIPSVLIDRHYKQRVLSVAIRRELHTHNPTLRGWGIGAG